MTKRELINTYLKSIGRTRVQGDSTEPLLPFLLGDAIYTIYNQDIAPLDLRREEKRLRNDWAENYTRFNRPCGGTNCITIFHNEPNNKVVAHEIYHIAYRVLATRGIEDEEAWAYLIGYITEMFYDLYLEKDEEEMERLNT